MLTACLVMERTEFAYETSFEDYTPKPDFVARARELVAQIEGTQIADDFVAFFFN